MDSQRLSLYGLKYNPFAPTLPVEALFASPEIEHFGWRIEQSLLIEGGFALLTGDPGTGKSVALRLVAERLAARREVRVGALAHPQSQIADFYREMGDLFGVALRPHNRWGGFKALRERWQEHIESTRIRPVLLIDEAQEMSPAVLSELRLLTSARFDSFLLLTVVLAGDARLRLALEREELRPLQSRIRVRRHLEPASSEQLEKLLAHLLERAGNPALLTEPLCRALCDHAAGNARVLTTLGAELLSEACARQCRVIDEKLFFEVFQPPAAASAPRRRAQAGRR
jgi:general secretion pathway protein A